MLPVAVSSVKGVLGFETHFLCRNSVAFIIRAISKTQGMKASFKVLFPSEVEPMAPCMPCTNSRSKKHEQSGFLIARLDKSDHLAARLSKRVTMVTGTSRSCTPLLPCLCFCSGQ